MDAPQADPLLGTAILLLTLASFAVWFMIFGRMKEGPILPYEPRRPVPWSGFWTLLPIAFVLMVLFGAISKLSSDGKLEEPDATASIEHLASGSVLQLALAGAYLAVAAGTSGAKWSDLGLPNSLRQFFDDVRIGVVAWLAAVAPVYVMQFALVTIFGQPEGHPLINMLEADTSSLLFLAAFLAAVVVAPLCEEVLFRLLLQGWLEKWEDSALGWRTPVGPPVLLVDEQGEAFRSETMPLEAPYPPATGPIGLPFGWLPIVLSSLLFALAHFGYGPDPIPLFLLALILGYVYQRTHRIVPCMVTHALFNGMSLFALWRIMSIEAP